MAVIKCPHCMKEEDICHAHLCPSCNHYYLIAMRHQGFLGEKAIAAELEKNDNKE